MCSSTLPADVADVADVADLVTAKDLRLGHLIPEGHTLATAVTEGQMDGTEIDAAVIAVRFLAGQALEESVSDLLAAAYERVTRKQLTDKWLEALEARYGLRGSPTSLDEAGKLAGVTRERVRQVTAKITPYMRDAWVPALIPALRVAIEGSPVPEPVGETLAPLGLSRAQLSGASLLGVAELVGVNMLATLGTRLEAAPGWLLDERERDVLGAVQIASRHTSKYGMTTVENIRQELSSADAPAEARDVEVVLASDARVRRAGLWLWLDKPCVSEHDNSMVNTIRHILAVNSPQTVASLQAGLRRNQKFRKRDIVPPTEAMAAFIDDSPHFTRAGELVEAVEELDYRKVLGPVAASMVDVLKASRWQAMDRASLMQAWEDAGVAAGTAGVWTTYSEWMDSFALNVWGLRGANPGAAVIAELQADAKSRRDSEPRRRRWKWTASGTVEILFDVSTSTRQSGTISLGETLGQTVGEQRLRLLVDGADVGELRVSNTHLWTWGWGPAMAATGAQVGDVLCTELDLGTRTATVTRGGQEFWRD